MFNVCLITQNINLLYFQPVQTSEHMGALGVFGLCQVASFVNYVKSRLTLAQFNQVTKFIAYVVGAVLAAAVAFLSLSGNLKIIRSFT